MHHVTPTGERVEPPSVTIIERRSALPWWFVEVACPLLWTAAALLLINLGYQAWQQTGKLDQQIAWAERV